MRKEIPEVPISSDLTEILERAHDVKSIIAEKGNVARDGVFRRSAYQTQRHNDMEESRQIVLAALRQGKNITEAMLLCGRQRNRFYAWCRESPRFEQQANEAVAAFSRAQTIRGMSALELNSDTKKVIKEDFATWTEYIVAFRKVYFGFDTFDHQWRMLEAMEKAPDGGVTEILVPPMAGKALALDTPLATPTGWTSMRDVQIGDELLGADGKPCRVTFKSEVFHGHECFEVRSSDGASVIADADHLWQVTLGQNKSIGNKHSPGWKAVSSLRTTKELATTRSKRPKLQLSAPLELPGADLTIPPYILGVWLGDGSSAGGRIYSDDDDAKEIRARFEELGFPTHDVSGKFAWSVLGLAPKLRELGVLNNKHIPTHYLRASKEQRLELLRGLVDTDGHVSPKGRAEITTVKSDFAIQILELVRSLGVKANLGEGRATIDGRYISQKYRISFMLKDCAYLQRKNVLTKSSLKKVSRYLTVTPVKSVPTQCIQVDSPDSLFLAGSGFMVTHNTTLLLDVICADLCSDANHRACFISGSLDFAVKQMGRVQRRFSVEGPPTRLIVDYGPFTTNDRSLAKKWNSQEITILASDHDEAEPSLGTYGMTGNIRGTRWNRMYLDDIQSVRTKNLTPNLIEIFRQDTMTRPVKSGKIIVSGSRVGKGDVYEELERLDLLNEVVVIPAMDYSKEMGKRTYFPLAFDHNNVAITDDAGDQLGFSDEWMETRRKQVGEDQWSRVYMMRPMSEFSAMVTEGDITNATDRDRVVGQQPMNSVANIAGLDPSLAAHAAYTYCAFDSEHLYVMGLTDLFKPNTNQRLFEEVRAGTIRYRPEYWVIENNTLQRGYLTDDAFLEMQEQYGFNAIGHHTGDNKLDPQLGVPSLMAAIVRGEVRFPTINENDTAFATLFDQLMSWRQDIPTRRLVQDQVMSLWFCYLLWRKLRDQVAVDLSGWKRQGAESVTMYPYATSNISGVEPEPVRKAPMTYAQHWDELSA